CSRSGCLMFNAFFFEIDMECLVQEFRASVRTNSNNLSLKIVLNHREKVFKNFWCFILGSYLNDVNARTKKPNVVPISASKPKRKITKSVATPHKKTVASDTSIQTTSGMEMVDS
ncbi:hypothetical protein Tco_0385331, partial [Tanacetum coccineum]